MKISRDTKIAVSVSNLIESLIILMTEESELLLFQLVCSFLTSSLTPLGRYPPVETAPATSQPPCYLFWTILAPSLFPHKTSQSNPAHLSHKDNFFMASCWCRGEEAWLSTLNAWSLPIVWYDKRNLKRYICYHSNNKTLTALKNNIYPLLLNC